MAREGRSGAPQEYRELILGAVLGMLLALVGVTFSTLEPTLGPSVRVLSIISLFLAGLGFGAILWIVSRRERATRQIHQAVANVTAGGVVVNDKEGKVVFANATLCSMVGRPMRDVLGKRFTELIAPDSHQLEEAEAMRRRLGASSVFEIVIPQRDGPSSTVLVSAQSLTAGERSLGSVAFLLDITGRKRAEHDVVQAKELAEFFLDLIAHDISNINQGAHGYAEILLAAGEMPAEQRRLYLQKILGQLDRSNTLIQNIRKISELRWTVGTKLSQDIDLEESIRQSIAMAMGSFPGRNVEVHFTNRAGTVRTRADYLATELFYNLIHNAIKYTPGDPAEVEVEVERLGGGSALVRVADHGRGIPDAAKEAVLSRIAPGKRSEGPSGYHSGIGLTLVNLIAKRFGWKVWIENRARGDYTKGSVLCVEVPPA